MMNGYTEIDAALNPCCAASDRQTWGWSRLNVSWYGSRLIRVVVGRLTMDVYWAGWRRVFCGMAGGANGSARYWTLFWPLGSISWVVRTETPEAKARRIMMWRRFKGLRERQSVKGSEVYDG